MYGIYQTLAVEPLPMFSPPAGAISAFGKYPDFEGSRGTCGEKSVDSSQRNDNSYGRHCNGQVDGLDLKLFKIDWCDQESTQNQLIFR